MKKIISLLLVLCMLATGMSTITANAAIVTIETISEGETWHKSWDADVETTSLKLDVNETGLYHISVTDHNQTAYFYIRIFDVETENFIGYISQGEIIAEYTSKKMYLAKDHKYELICSYFFEESTSDGYISYTVDADLSIEFNKTTEEIPAISNKPLSSSNMVAQFTEDDTHLWLKIKTTTAGDYDFNFDNLRAVVYIYNIATGEQIYSMDTEYWDYEYHQYYLKDKNVFTLEANTEYYIFIAAYENTTTKLSMTKSEKDVKSIVVNEPVYPITSFHDMYSFGDESLYNYLVTYADGTTEIQNHSLAEQGYILPVIKYLGESFYLNHNYYLYAGEQILQSTYNGVTTDVTIYVESLYDYCSDSSLIKENQNCKISYQDSNCHEYLWRVKVSDSGYYGIWRNNTDDFETNFDYYSIDILDNKNNIIEYDYNEEGWPLKANEEYVLVFYFCYNPDYSNNDIVFWLQKENDLPEEKNGWIYENGWFYYENGEKLTNQWKKDSTGWCYLGADGKMLTNAWIQDSIGWCYIGSDGYCLTNCWMADSIGWCYLDSEGSMVKNSWILDGGKWYYLDSNGYMVSNNWRQDSKGWCYLGADGAMATNQWIMDSVGWCYVGADGYCLTNCWMADSIGWCYLDGNGRMVVNDWVLDSTGWCWLDESGYWDGIYY